MHTSGHFDLHQQMVPENLAACFILSMYLPHLHELKFLTGKEDFHEQYYCFVRQSA